MYVRRVGGSPHLPAMLPPLLSALEQAAKPSGSQALADRLQVDPPPPSSPPPGVQNRLRLAVHRSFCIHPFHEIPSRVAKRTRACADI